MNFPSSTSFLSGLLLSLINLSVPILAETSTNPSSSYESERRGVLAWGGYLPKNAAQTGMFGGKPFRPFYVPTGSEVIYAKYHSHQLQFSGSGWEDPKPDHDDGRETRRPGDWVEITWKGEDLEYFGFKAGDKLQGVRQIGIYLDGQRQDDRQILKCNVGPSYKEQLIYQIHHQPNQIHHLKIVHEGQPGEILSVFGFVITNRDQHQSEPTSSTLTRIKLRNSKRALATATEPWTLVQQGDTGVAAMQLSVVSDTEAIIIDKVSQLQFDL